MEVRPPALEPCAEPHVRTYALTHARTDSLNHSDRQPR